MTYKLYELEILAHQPVAASPKIVFASSPVAAGFPSVMESFVENALDLNELLIKHPASTFFIRVMGDSMVNAGIQSHDILIVDRSLVPANNKIAVVRIGEEFTVKRLKFEGTQLILVPENDAYAPIELQEDMDVEIWGVVTTVIHRV